MTASQVGDALSYAPCMAELSALAQAVRGFSAENLVWASGYLAGLAAAQQAGDISLAAAIPARDGSTRLTILYGSQTGNAKRVAGEIAVQAAQQSIAARVVSMADYRLPELGREAALLIVVSTHGDGEPPDDAEELHEYLAGARAPDLKSLSYSVLALGDSSYADFCRTGRDFDERLSRLGARRLIERVDCDLDFEDPAAKWAQRALAQAATVLVETSSPRVPSLQAVAGARYTAEHTFAAQLTVNQKITGRDSGKDVRHIEFSIEGSGLRYEPGDALGIVTLNPPMLVAELIGELGLDGAAIVDDRSVADALGSCFEITVASASFVERYALLVGSEELRKLTQPESRRSLSSYLASRQIIDIIREHPGRPEAGGFLQCLRKLKPRLYSIASSPLVSPDEVAVTVAAVRYEAFGAPHWGAASTHLADRAEPGSRLGIYVEPNPRFRLPKDPSRPVIMIGPGTGVAPFRAFLEHREAAGANGPNWLFFGDRTFRNDFLYQLDWARFRKNGVLTRMDVAFSRDQQNKVYVQDRIRENAAELVAWLERGAHVYVCGDAAAMAPDVHQALIDAIAIAGKRESGTAAEYLKQLRRSGRYQRDIY